VQLSREALERNAVLELIKEDGSWGADGEAEQVSELFLTLKEAVRLGRSSEEIVETLLHSSLTDQAANRRAVAMESTPGEAPVAP
jgi:hypothetical protein